MQRLVAMKPKTTLLLVSLALMLITNIQTHDWSCTSLTLSPANAIGIMLVPAETDMTRAYILYKVSGKNHNLRLDLASVDAEALRNEVSAMISGLRSKIIKFETAVDKQGQCYFTEIRG